MSRPTHRSPAREDAARRRLAELRARSGTLRGAGAVPDAGGPPRIAVLRPGPLLQDTARGGPADGTPPPRDGAYAALERVVLDRAERAALAEIAIPVLRDSRRPSRPAFEAGSAVGGSAAPDRRIVCDAARPGPAAAVDGALLEDHPHGVVEAIVTVGHLLGAGRGTVCILDSAKRPAAALAEALAEAGRAGLVGPDVLGAGIAVEMELRAVPRTALAMTDTALLRMLEGARPTPVPLPMASSGECGRTPVIGVEALLRASAVLAGRAAAADFRVVHLAGPVRRCGLAEVPRTTGVRKLIDEVGGGVGPRRLLGARVGDLAGWYLPLGGPDPTLADLEDLGIDPSAVIALDDSICVLGALASDIVALAGESCGKCPSCRVGLPLLAERISRIERGIAPRGEPAATAAWASHVEETAMCRVGRRGGRAVRSVLEGFPEEVDSHLEARRCRPAPA